jgi:hypothetical protein
MIQLLWFWLFQALRVHISTGHDPKGEIPIKFEFSTLNYFEIQRILEEIKNIFNQLESCLVLF